MGKGREVERKILSALAVRLVGTILSLERNYSYISSRSWKFCKRENEIR